MAGAGRHDGGHDTDPEERQDVGDIRADDGADGGVGGTPGAADGVEPDVDALRDLARALGVPERAFDRDHYDIPEHLHARALALGAEHVSGRELVARLRAAGLRRPKLRA
jgi:hypothetical protein